MPAITYEGILRVKQVFKDAAAPVPETVDMWDLDYARDVANVLLNFELLFGVDPQKDKSKLMDVLGDLGVYDPADQVKNYK